MKRVGVVGAGVMGSEIAQVGAAAGLAVRMYDSDAAALDRAIAHIGGICARRVARGRLSEEEADAILGRITTGTTPSVLADCDIVIEAVTEVMEVKRAVMAMLGALLPPEAIVASNTSALSISDLGVASGRPDRTLGLHFFNPASVMRLVEVVRGADTSDATADAGAALAAAIGKTPVVVRECPGFLVNRILLRALAVAYRVAGAEHADRGGTDTAVTASGPAPMGPFALGDLVGLDTLGNVLVDLRAAYGERFEDGGAVAEQVAAGRFGAKSGCGFFDAPSEGGSVGVAEARASERYYLAAFDEACRCLEDEIASRDDIDRALELGAGWAFGPIAWANGLGIREVTARLDGARDAHLTPRPDALARLDLKDPK